jgi:hypothetical protein
MRNDYVADGPEDEYRRDKQLHWGIIGSKIANCLFHTVISWPHGSSHGVTDEGDYWT